jgi:integrase
MPRKYPGVRQRKDGLWEGRYDVYVAGKRQQRAVYAGKAQEAWDRLQEARGTAARGILTSNPTMGQYLTRWIAAKEGTVAFTTSQRYRHIIEDHLVPALGRIPLKKLTLADVNAMLASRSHLAPRTLHHLRAVLRNSLNDALAENLVDRNVADLRVSLPRIPRARDNFLEPSEAARLFEAAKGDRLEAVFSMLALGLRPPSEVCGLRWRDVDLEATRPGATRPTLTTSHGMHRQKGKGLFIKELKSESSRRNLPLPRFAIAALTTHHARQSAERLEAKDWLAGSEGDFVFTTKVGTPLNPDDLRDYVYEVMKRVGLEGRITLYGMRHTAASLLYSQTHDFKLVAAFLGHSSVSMAQKTYVHLLDGSDGRAADALDRALGGA